MSDGDLYLVTTDDESGDVYLLTSDDLSPLGERIYELLGPLTRRDATNGQLLRAVAAVLAVGEEPMWALCEYPGAVEFLAPDLAPTAWLPWLAAIVGARFTPAMSEQQQRREIEHPSGYERGRPDTLVALIASQLTDTRSVLFHEEPYALTVRTRLAETPNAAAVRASLLDSIPAARDLDYAAADERDWSEVEATWETWADVADANVTWADVNIP